MMSALINNNNDFNNNYNLHDDRLDDNNDVDDGSKRELLREEKLFTARPLRYYLVSDIWMEWALMLLLLRWPTMKELKTIKGKIVLLVYSLIGIASILSVIVLGVSIVKDRSLSVTMVLLTSNTFLAVFSQLCSAVAVMYFGYHRLWTPCLAIDIAYYRPATYPCFYFGSGTGTRFKCINCLCASGYLHIGLADILVLPGFIIIGVVATLCLTLSGDSASLANIVFAYNDLFLNILTSATLCVSILFFLVDTSIARAIVRELTVMAKSRTLTLEVLAASREEIRWRIQRSGFVNNVMTVAAAINGVCFLIVTFFNFMSYLPNSSTLTYIGSMLTTIAMLLKEVCYLVIVYIEAARVNDEADALASELGTADWSNTATIESQSESCNNPIIVALDAKQSSPITNDPTQSSLLVVSAFSQEYMRMRLFIACQADPISIRVLCTRPTRRAVYLQLLGYCTALIIGIVNSLIQSSLH